MENKHLLDKIITGDAKEKETPVVEEVDELETHITTTDKQLEEQFMLEENIEEW